MDGFSPYPLTVIHGSQNAPRNEDITRFSSVFGTPFLGRLSTVSGGPFSDRISASLHRFSLPYCVGVQATLPFSSLWPHT